MEGCITMGRGYALSEELWFTGGGIHDRDSGSYKIPSFSCLPSIEPAILDARDKPAQGRGELAVICMGAMVANPAYDARANGCCNCP